MAATARRCFGTPAPPWSSRASSRNAQTKVRPMPQLGEGEEPGLCAAMTMASEHHPPQLESCVSVVRQWLDKITAASTNPDLDLRNLRAVLTHLLEKDPTIDAAVDNLADAASAYLKEVELAAGMQTKAGDRAVARRLNALEHLLHFEGP